MNRKPIPERLVRPLAELKYSAVASVFYEIDLWDGCWLWVVGDGDNACYEWVIELPNEPLKFSNAGYGVKEVALRDGLIEFFGLPTDVGTRRAMLTQEAMIAQEVGL